jgi:hypothetical protein
MALSGFDDYCRWQQRVEWYRSSGLTVKEFCLQEGLVPRSFYRWMNRLKNGLPEEVREEQAEREEGESSVSLFLPIALKTDVEADMVEIELPNGSRVRLPVGVSRSVLVEVVRAAAQETRNGSFASAASSSRVGFVSGREVV